MPVAARLQEIHARVATACVVADRDPAGVTIVGVSKTVGRCEIDAAYAAGLRDFAENRVQDALAKFTDDWPVDATRHMIGSLQTNKVAPALRVIDLFHSVDRPSLVKELSKQAVRSGRNVPVLLQINIARESQKNGCDPDDALVLARSILDSPGLALRGLMTMAPLVDDAESVRSVFARLRMKRDEFQQTLGIELQHLSMGMTNDFEVAVQEGATIVRIGRAIFGPNQV